MIEDVNFTKRIVQVVADHPRFPARMRLEDLAEQLQLQPGRNDEEKLIYHLVCAYQAGLLHANYDTYNTFEGTRHVFGYIDGLTHIGSEYGHHMKGPSGTRPSSGPKAGHTLDYQGGRQVYHGRA